jgi:hypothetical protein
VLPCSDDKLLFTLFGVLGAGALGALYLYLQSQTAGL